MSPILTLVPRGTELLSKSSLLQTSQSGQKHAAACFAPQNCYQCIATFIYSIVIDEGLEFVNQVVLGVVYVHVAHAKMVHLTTTTI